MTCRHVRQHIAVPRARPTAGRVSPAQGIVASMLAEVGQRGQAPSTEHTAPAAAEDTASNPTAGGAPAPTAAPASLSPPSSPNPYPSAAVAPSARFRPLADPAQSAAAAEGAAPAAVVGAVLIPRKGVRRRQAGGQGKEASLSVLCRTPEQVGGCA